MIDGGVKIFYFTNFWHAAGLSAMIRDLVEK